MRQSVNMVAATCSGTNLRMPSDLQGNDAWWPVTTHGGRWHEPSVNVVLTGLQMLFRVGAVPANSPFSARGNDVPTRSLVPTTTKTALVMRMG